MKRLGIEESLKRAFAYGDGGRSDCLHAARPQVREVGKAVDALRKVAAEERE